MPPLFGSLGEVLSSQLGSCGALHLVSDLGLLLRLAFGRSVHMLRVCQSRDLPHQGPDTEGHRLGNPHNSASARKKEARLRAFAKSPPE